jgi:hypothetical protein
MSHEQNVARAERLVTLRHRLDWAMVVEAIAGELDKAEARGYDAGCSDSLDGQQS